MSIPPLLPANAYQPTHTSDDVAPARSARVKRGLANSYKRWPDGIVTVALDLRDEKSKALMVDVIREWAHHTPSLRFKIVDGTEGDIRISDDEGLKGNWSSIGTDAKRVPKDRPTLHLDRTDDSKKFRTTALHEFGHALGLLHEHQHPDHTLDWNRPAAYDYYTSDSVSRALVNEQILNKFSGPALQVTPYDPQSVMHYHIPAELRNHGPDVPRNTSLSKGDQHAIRQLYAPKIAKA